MYLWPVGASLTDPFICQQTIGFLNAEQAPAICLPIYPSYTSTVLLKIAFKLTNIIRVIQTGLNTHLCLTVDYRTYIFCTKYGPLEDGGKRG